MEKTGLPINDCCLKRRRLTIFIRFASVIR